ncbi:MAG: VOC family protein [Elusimicrobia bacterium]|nr:VOC family protein [Elusimicrobiota bacterium]
MDVSHKPIPEDYHSLTPLLAVRDAAKAIGFYKNAFHAREMSRQVGPGGRVLRVELRIGDSVFLLTEESLEAGSSSPQTLGGTPVGLYLYVPDVETAFVRARIAGAKVRKPLRDTFWGDRCGQLGDPFGHVWTLAERREALTPAQMQERALRQCTQPAAV